MPIVKRNLKFPCWKCKGTGRILGFSHIANGECFACGGSGEKFGRLPKGHVPCGDCREVTAKRYQETIYISTVSSLPVIGVVYGEGEKTICVGCAAEREAKKAARPGRYCSHPNCYRTTEVHPAKAARGARPCSGRHGRVVLALVAA